MQTGVCSRKSKGLLFEKMVLIGVAVDAGCERIHREGSTKSKVYSFSKRGKGLDAEKCTSDKRLGL